MNNKTTISIIVGALLVVAVALAFILQKNANDSNDNSNINQSPTNQVTANQNENLNLSPTRELTEEEVQRQQIERASSIFIERYGTYNGSFTMENLENTRDLMTESFATTTENAISDNSGGGVSISTTTIAVNITSFSLSDSATVEVDTLREQVNTDDGTENLVSQKATIRFLYVNEEWKVNSSQWQAAQQIDSL